MTPRLPDRLPGDPSRSGRRDKAAFFSPRDTRAGPVFPDHSSYDWEPYDEPEPLQLWPPLAPGERSCCCPAPAAYRVILPPTKTRSTPVDLLLCRHHLRVSAVSLRLARAMVLTTDGYPAPMP
jgi:hypothetical protein